MNINLYILGGLLLSIYNLNHNDMNTTLYDNTYQHIRIFNDVDMFKIIFNLECALIC